MNTKHTPAHLGYAARRFKLAAQLQRLAAEVDSVSQQAQQPQTKEQP
jgi:prefoldin subunit 5